MASINPLEFFSIGEQIGRTNSPVSGVGGAIRNLLDDARKKGLLQAQSQFQGQEARATEQFKQGFEPSSKTVHIANPETGETINTLTINPEDSVKLPTLPSKKSPAKIQMEQTIADQMEAARIKAEGGATTNPVRRGPKNDREKSIEELVAELQALEEL